MSDESTASCSTLWTRGLSQSVGPSTDVQNEEVLETMKHKDERLRWPLILIALVITLAPVASAHDRGNHPKGTASGSLPTLTSPLEPAPAGLSGRAIIERMRLENERRNARLEQYSEERTYEVSSTAGKVSAAETLEMSFQAPNHRTFVRQSERGSWAVRKLVFERLVKSEIKTSNGQAQRSSSISTANYDFTLIGEQRVGLYPCFVVQVAPKRKDEYLFVGTIWIEKADFAVVRVSGHPAKKLSFWIERADFVRQYQLRQGFWLLARDETLVKVRLFGRRLLIIEHDPSSLNGRPLPAKQTALAPSGSAVGFPAP